MGLLDRIQKAKITVKSRINPNDYTAMEALEKERKNLVADYNTNKKHLEYTEATYRKVAPDYIKESLVIINFKELHSNLEERYVDKLKVLIGKVEAYFNHAYGLNKLMTKSYNEFQGYYEARDTPKPSCVLIKNIWECVELYLSILGGLSLVEGSEQKLIDDFRDKIIYINRVVAKNKVLKLDCSWFCAKSVDRYDSSKGECIDDGYRGSANLRNLYRVISFFETGFLGVNKLLDHLPLQDNDPVIYTKKQPIEGLDKINGITFLKGKSIKLSFKTKANVDEFIAFFRLNELEKSRW